MGYFLGLDNRQIYVEDDGTYWESQYKRTKLDPKDLFPEKVSEAVTVSVVEIPEKSTETVVEIIEPESVEFKCDICGRIAGSNAGLAAHKRSHK